MERGCGLWIDDAGKIDQENDVAWICNSILAAVVSLSEGQMTPLESPSNTSALCSLLYILFHAKTLRSNTETQNDLLYSLRFFASSREISYDKSNKKNPDTSGLIHYSGWRQPEY